MNFKARTLKKNSFILGFGRGAQVWESFIFGSEFTAQASTLGVSFLFGMLQTLGSHQPTVLEEDGAFFNNAKQDSETATFQAAVRCCVRATLAD